MVRRTMTGFEASVMSLSFGLRPESRVFGSYVSQT